ncbi:hypothetical protein PDE_07015 [Penicillium oxalicum 114-2]|uniref:Uncharacterized protein n=1 Tax=Penicillium oxalicum (strain 114-2 / CGMCC 5302) TaxID=933388 RepID=S7ZTG4_PENO1|nr:hypothetical protein PDE_07015 [Penicillium oxalicum 114-2]
MVTKNGGADEEEEGERGEVKAREWAKRWKKGEGRKKKWKTEGDGREDGSDGGGAKGR